MAENKKRFSFDDTEEENASIKDTQRNENKTDTFAFNKESTLSNDAKTEDSGDTMMPKKKKKRKLKKWQIAIIACVSVCIMFVIYVFVASNNDGPVYGDRCASLLAIDTARFIEIETAIKENPAIQDIKIELDCRILKMTITYPDNTKSEDAKNLAAAALHTFDDALGNVKEEGTVYSQLFGKANGKGQYNVEFYLKSNGDAGFPIFGTKHPSTDTIAFTGALPANQETTDKVLAPKEITE